MSKRQTETEEEHRERLQRESDFAGEFGEVRKTNLTVDADKLISGSKPKNKLKGIKLFRSLGERKSGGGVGNGKGNGVGEVEKRKSVKEEPQAKKQKLESNVNQSIKTTEYHLNLDDDETENNDPIVTNKLKLTKIRDDDEDLDDEDSQPRFININALKALGKSNISNDTPIYHLDPNDDEPETIEKETHIIDTPETTQKNNVQENNDNNDNDDDDNDDEFFDAQDQTLEVNLPDRSTDQINEMQIVNLKVKLYSKLTGKSNRIPYGLESKFQDIYKLLESTIKDHESQSALVVGPKNSGKTAVLNSVLDQLRSNISQTNEDFLLIKISGITQEDDKSAVKSIARQLDLEISRAYHINIRTLDDNELLAQKSVTEAFANILSILDKHILTEKSDQKFIKLPIIFIIDEVDVYASPNRQTLLYNLFDLVENSSTPITTLCFSSKFTVKDMFEKRVRSRFSQRMIQFPKFPMGQFVSVAEKILSIDEPTNDYEIKWNEYVTNLINNDSSLRKIVIYNHLTVNNFKDFYNHCTYPISKISSQQPFLNDLDFNKYLDNHSKNSIIKIINSLSEIEISLLICAARLVVKNDINWINLNTTYEEYLQLSKSTNQNRSSTIFNINSINTGFKIWSKEKCEEPWIFLQKINLLTSSISSSTSNNNKTNKSIDFSNNTVETKMWQLEITLDELRLIVDSDKNVKSWTRL
ncbi:Origin recognition complex subunit 4 [Wickerhamomyces ciferrii]|uniref:Origin recognition complex subunit 4 n=1 Tax=Wickerhamomyces ciferrii (strain ATCC 14091 / BCRC 22168 / CBS 111 / JCM 3599 / NBRC 0793 / NRRL Y-1031 F-60-10) TaxID=1206466 RepID=K0KNE5_WICCF|nr:Origin recognition complex subunit 4 [Wickerhamomyces ciferrii]CCH42648.1 Origin recognition complex subunit 4 [Wickerhamomyces ciferrii]